MIAAALLSLSSEAKDFRIGAKEFLAKVDEGKIGFDRAPMMHVPVEVIDKFVEAEKAKYPNLKANMVYVQYIKTNNRSLKISPTENSA